VNGVVVAGMGACFGHGRPLRSPRAPLRPLLRQFTLKPSPVCITRFR
jgi:hypothetical protein